MENKLELADPNLQIFCLDGTKLSKEKGLVLAQAINKMALAKNIKLAEGSLAVWEECLIEDIKRKCFDFEDFINATALVIRRPAYNRIDYSDIFSSALDFADKRLRKIRPQSDEVYNRLRIISNMRGEITGEEQGPIYRENSFTPQGGKLL